MEVYKMRHILKNKKTLVLTTMIGLMMIIVGFSSVIAKPPADKIPSDDDWIHSDTGIMYPYYIDDDVGIGTSTPTSELDVNGVITASGGDSDDWNTAFGWDDHGSVGYLTGESDPIYSAAPAFGITTGDISDWNTAYGWGDHSTEGYDTTDDTWEMTVEGNISTLDNVTIGTPLFPIIDTKLYVTADNTDQNAIIGYTSETGRTGVSGIGVYGNGVYGISYFGIGVNGRSTEGTAIYGWTSSGLAGNFQGDVNINGDLTVSGDIIFTPETKIGYLTVPAADFMPKNNSYNYENVGYRLSNLDGNCDVFYAPVYLPNGSKITNMTFYWRDQSVTNEGSVIFSRANHGQGSSDVFTIFTSGSDSTVKSSYLAPGFDVIIDNSKSGYHIKLDLPDTLIHYFSVLIEYEYS